jgi:iron complex transport system substrate-binding protein
MAARTTGLTAVLALWLVTACAPPTPPAPATAGSRRVVSLVPAATEMLFAIGAGPQVVGVSSYDRFPPEVTRLPRVGALLDPDTERILALRPDLVVVYASQQDQVSRLHQAGIATYTFRHEGRKGGIAEVFNAMDDLGRATGHAQEARRVIRDVTERLNTVRGRVAGRARPRTLLVIGRQPGTLQGLYASGGIGFLHEMLEVAGGVNVFADVARESVQPSHEVLLSRAPDAIVELSAQAASDATRERGVWALLASIPAVRANRLAFLSGEYLVVAGPRLAEGTETLARALHPEAFTGVAP